MAMANDSSHLLEKENIAPNQHSWPEMAAQMRVKCSNKTKKGKVDSALTAEHIDERNHKHATNHDPYGAEEQSSKCAKLNARLAVINA